MRYYRRRAIVRAIARVRASVPRYVLLVLAIVTLIALFGAGLEQAANRSHTIVTRGTTAGFAVTMTEWGAAIIQSAAVLGVLSMVLIQSVKTVFRENFHKRSVRQWLLVDDSRSWELLDVLRHDDIDPNTAYDELLDLIAPSYKSDVFGLPVEQLAAQIASAAELALSNPSHYRVLALLGGAERYQDMRRYAAYVREAASQSDDPDASSASWVQSRNELGHHIQRRIDGWQIHSANRWKTALRLAAVAVSASLAFFGVFLSGSFFMQPYTSYTFVLTVGLLGGLLASIARDLIAIVEKHRI